MKQYYVYIMANDRPTLYVGMTNDLIKRVYDHRDGLIDGFTKTYGLTKLVYFEQTENVESAIRREKRLKHWNRQWKLDLIRSLNPNMDDLYPNLIDDSPVKPENDKLHEPENEKANAR